MMKRKLFTALLALTTATAFADQTVLINGNPAQKDAASIQFDGDKATVAFTDGSNFTYDMEQLLIKFSKSTSSVGTNSMSFLKLNTVVKDVLNIEGTTAGDVVKITDVLGVVIYQNTATAENLNIDASPFAKGVYMLTIGNQCVKFVKE